MRGNPSEQREGVLVGRWHPLTKALKGVDHWILTRVSLPLLPASGHVTSGSWKVLGFITQSKLTGRGSLRAAPGSNLLGVVQIFQCSCSGVTHAAASNLPPDGASLPTP